MRKSKPKKNKNKIDSDIFRPSARHGDKVVISNVIHKLSSYNMVNNIRLIKELASHPLLPAELNTICSHDNRIKTYSFNKIISDENYFYWQMGLFIKNANLLNAFCSLRKDFNAELLSGNYDNALRILDDVDELTFSWWSTEMRVHINKEFTNKDTKRYIDNIKIIKGDTHQLKFISVMSEASVETQTKLLVDQLREYITAGIPSIVNYGECLRLLYLSPHRLLSLEAGESSFSIMRKFLGEPIIDQYLLFKCILSSYNGMESNIDKIKVTIIKEANAIILDDEVKNLLVENSQQLPFISVVLTSYTSGNYAKVIEMIKSHDHYETGGLLEVYARSKIYLKDNSDITLYDKLANYLAEILSVKKGSLEKTMYLVRLCNKFRHEQWSKSLHYHISKIISEKYDDIQVESLRGQTRFLGGFNTPKALEKDFIPNYYEYLKSKILPFDREIKYDNVRQMELNINCEMFPIESDFLKLQSKIFIKKSDFTSLANFIFLNYLENNLSHLFLPIREACDIIIKMEEIPYSDYIAYLIVLDIYSKVHDKKHDDVKTSLFEDFILKSESYEPSKIFNSDTYTISEVYFLRNLCTLDQIDNIIYFKSDEEVVLERVTILDKIISYYRKKDNLKEAISLMIERDSVLESLFSENLRAKLETGKLYVDLQSMESQNKHIYQDYYDRAKSLKDGILLEQLDENLEEATDIFKINEDKSVVASSQRSDLLVNFYYKLAKDFAASDEYGLDKYLSAEIRHNVFVSQIRSCFEKANLITEHSDNGYETNQYWMNTYSYISDKIMQRIDSRLKQFSSEIDAEINEVNNRFRVVTYDKTDAIFNFSCYYSRIYFISKIINESSNYNDFYVRLLDYMWSLSGGFAKNCQNVIEEEFKKNITQIIESLERDLNMIKGGTAIVNLMDEVRLVKAAFYNEVETVINWFRFVGKDNDNNYERVEVVIEATLSAFLSIYGHKSPNISSSLTKSERVLNYRQSRSLFISLFTALENALNYRVSLSPIEIAHFIDDNGHDIIILSNQTNNFKSDEESATFIEKLHELWNSDNSELNIIEGGSGLYKMRDILYKCADFYSLEVNITQENSLFSVGIGISK
ncbi:hypothetical protein [Brenneria goodwinii]|uniref:hypothetical protein n=1 Tax=Brenneria goodwinii TaxID=1109412 RepID=UPI0036E7DBF1